MAERQAGIVHHHASQVASGVRSRQEESWIDISSRPSSSSLSSAADESAPSTVQPQPGQRIHRRRRVLHGQTTLSAQQDPQPASAQDLSSQEEYDESESESDRVMTSSGEEPHLRGALDGHREAPESTRLASGISRHNVDSDDDENRTAVNYPINSGNVFTPQPNAFSHPPATQVRSASQPVPGSYFPTVRRLSARQADLGPLPRHRSETHSHLPRNVLSPSYNAAAHHDEALRSSLSTLLSCAAAARGLKSDPKQQATHTTALPQHSNRIDPTSLRLVPESALPAASTFDLQAPIFKPTLRRHSTTTTSTSPERVGNKSKRSGRASSKERRIAKKVRHSASADELFISPTLLTWVVSAGVLVALSALSFGAGYSMGREAGRMEAGSMSGVGTSNGGGIVKDCAREASRGGLGLKRGLARSAVQV